MNKIKFKNWNNSQNKYKKKIYKMKNINKLLKKLKNKSDIKKYLKVEIKHLT